MFIILFNYKCAYLLIKFVDFSFDVMNVLSITLILSLTKELRVVIDFFVA